MLNLLPHGVHGAFCDSVLWTSTVSVVAGNQILAFGTFRYSSCVKWMRDYEFTFEIWMLNSVEQITSCWRNLKALFRIWEDSPQSHFVKWTWRLGFQAQDLANERHFLLRISRMKVKMTCADVFVGECGMILAEVMMKMMLCEVRCTEGDIIP